MKKEIKKTNLNNCLKDMLIGCLLGDAHIGISGNGKAFITFEQSIKHKSYILHINEKLIENNVDVNDIKYYSRKNSENNVLSESIYLKTHNLESLYPLAEIFLYSNKKIIPSDISSYITPRALAYWICDDGQLVKKGGITLCTDNYSLHEVNLLIDALNVNFKADCSIHYKKGKSGVIYNRIYIKKRSFDNIKPLILEHIHEYFLYKLHK